MARWQPGTRERLQSTALELFLDRGFEATTVADIARAADVTERTFFRHFADKREVLFASQDAFIGLFVGPVEDAPADIPPIELIARALDGAGSFFPEDRREWSRRRQTVIDAEPALGERELAKLSGLGRRLAEVLRGRGVPEPAATLLAQSGVTVFHLAFAQWIAPGETRTLPELATERLDALAASMVRQHA
ncbi:MULTISPECIES: TetR family transcriptional regulator [unclassified Curtobacterium]|uniref:TetR family transcriptional regulator n=1 Tax=unclassified Curtobacterium TaxID=257496 RepID=UPI000D85B51A|nr:MULTISPECIES: TetR family transcriptional regulator [unclassified Curtobacterium]PZE83285.1 TetR family transcriptional regulator [Curtobacterium sp. MCBD17_032]WIB14942.1 TetR family transcriptional regulator [Curtobacterium sp. MCPF17_050]